MTKLELREQLKAILAIANPTNFIEPEKSIDTMIDDFLERLARWVETDPRIRH